MRRALTRRSRRLLPLAAVLLGVAGAGLIPTASAAAQSNCGSGGAAPRSAAAPPTTSPPNETCGFQSATLNDIRSGDASELLVTSDPPAFLDLRVNLDPPITCTYQRRVYQGLSGDQYNVIVNGGDPVGQPTLHMQVSTAVAGGLQGAQLIIDRGQAQACFGSPKPFTVKPGSSLVRTDDPGIGVQYVGLLPDCGGPPRGVGPCISRRTASLLPTPSGGSTGVVNIFVTVPPGYDPRIHC